MRLVIDDGGRAAAGFTGSAGDCTVRAIAIATERPYREVYDDLFERNRADRQRQRNPRRKARSASPRDGGTRKEVINEYLAERGWVWVPTMQIGSGCTTHLRADELPAGRLIVRVTKHVCAVIDGVLHDTGDCTRGGTRCVYGYWQPGN